MIPIGWLHSRDVKNPNVDQHRSLLHRAQATCTCAAVIACSNNKKPNERSKKFRNLHRDQFELIAKRAKASLRSKLLCNSRDNINYVYTMFSLLLWLSGCFFLSQREHVCDHVTSDFACWRHSEASQNFVSMQRWHKSHSDFMNSLCKKSYF